MNTLENNRNTITKETALGLINSKLVISSEGKFRVKVTNCNDFYRQGQYSNTVAICNFNAMTPYQRQQAIVAGKEGRYNDAANYNLNLSIREGQYKPAKGEIVDIVVEYVALKDKSTGLPTGEQALLVTSLSPIQAIKATKGANVSFDDFDEVSSSVIAPEMEVEPLTKPVKA